MTLALLDVSCMSSKNGESVKNLISLDKRSLMAREIERWNDGVSVTRAYREYAVDEWKLNFAVYLWDELLNFMNFF